MLKRFTWSNNPHGQENAENEAPLAHLFFASELFSSFSELTEERNARLGSHPSLPVAFFHRGFNSLLSVDRLAGQQRSLSNPIKLRPFGSICPLPHGWVQLCFWRHPFSCLFYWVLPSPTQGPRWWPWYARIEQPLRPTAGPSWPTSWLHWTASPLSCPRRVTGRWPPGPGTARSMRSGSVWEISRRMTATSVLLSVRFRSSAASPSSRPLVAVESSSTGNNLRLGFHVPFSIENPSWRQFSNHP